MDLMDRQFCLGRRGLMRAMLLKPFSNVVGGTQISITESVPTPHDPKEDPKEEKKRKKTYFPSADCT